MPKRADPDPILPILATMSDAVAAGLTPDQVRQRTRSEAWTRIARGAYLPAGFPVAPDLDPFSEARIRHVHRAVAAALRNSGATIAYTSAAYVHGLPVLGDVPEEVTLAVPPGHWTGRRSGVRFRRLRLDPADVLHLRVPVTTVARTWLDVTCRGVLADSLTIGDAALARKLLTVASAKAVLERGALVAGASRAVRALPLINGLRETPLESASFAYFVEHRLPLPRMQVEISGAAGLVGRVDFLWSGASNGAGVVGESDGLVKYGDRGEAYREKRREDRLRELGFIVMRWGFADLRTAALAERLRRSLLSGE